MKNIVRGNKQYESARIEQNYMIYWNLLMTTFVKWEQTHAKLSYNYLLPKHIPLFFIDLKESLAASKKHQ